MTIDRSCAHCGRPSGTLKWCSSRCRSRGWRRERRGLPARAPRPAARIDLGPDPDVAELAARIGEQAGDVGELAARIGEQAGDVAELAARIRAHIGEENDDA